MLRLVLCALLCISSIVTAAEAPLVAVASNLTQAVTEIAGRFKSGTGIMLKLSFGSSGNFARQILQGAPFQLFLSADKKYVDMLRDNGQKFLQTSEYARGRIGFFIPEDSRLSGTAGLNEIINAIEFDDYRRMAIANPEVAPFGLAAEQALSYAGVWYINRNKLLLGENAAQTVQYSLSGAVDIGIIPASAAIQPEVRAHGSFIPIPETWHQPIQHYLVLFADANPSAIRFYDYLLTEAAQRILVTYGYSPNMQD